MVSHNNENNNNNYTIVHDSESKGAEEENFFEDELDEEIEMILMTTLPSKSGETNEKLQAKYKKDANKIFEHKQKLQKKI